MSRVDACIAACFIAMVACGLGAFRVHRSLEARGTPFARRGVHALGCLAFWVLALAMMLIPAIALPFAIGFFVLAVIARVSEPRAGPRLPLLMFLCGAVWAAYAGYEYALQTWFRSAHGAKPRPDFFLIVPLVYAVTVLGLFHAARVLSKEVGRRSS